MYFDTICAKAATDNALHTSPNYPNGTEYGTHVISKYFSGGFNFVTFGEAFDYIAQLAAKARRDGLTSDFHAAISTRDGHTIAVW